MKNNFIKKLTPVLEESFIEMVKITQAKDVEGVLRKVWNENGEDKAQLNYIEKFYVLFLNRANMVVGYSLISIGGISSTVADGKVIFSNALMSGCSAIILAHNHPSNKLIPSEQDISLTKRFVKFGKLIDLLVYDHIIIGCNSGEYYSLAENGDI